MLMSMVMGGLAANTPHMISASVMALARLLFEVRQTPCAACLPLKSTWAPLVSHISTWNARSLAKLADAGDTGCRVCDA